MHAFRLLLAGVGVAFIGSLIAHSQSPAGPPVLYDNARLILGDARAPIERGAFVVQDGRITAIGASGAVSAPAGSTRVDLAGRTVPGADDVGEALFYRTGQAGTWAA